MLAADSTPVALGNRKLVVLGIPWDVDTEGLRQFMSKYGELSDVIVMKDRTTGRSRGFGYVTFANPESAEKALGSSHFLNGRMLDVKVATPKEIIQPAEPPPASRKKRIFVARIPLTVTQEAFKSYFAKYGPIADIYMPRDRGSPVHRGIGFVTFEHSEPVDKVMSETHELGGSTVAVDRATPKDKLHEGGKSLDKVDKVDKVDNVDKVDKLGNLPYGVFNSYLNAAARLGFFGMPPFFPNDYPGYGFPNEMGGAGGQGNAFGAGNNRPSMSLGNGALGLSEHSAEASAYLSKSSAYGPSGSAYGPSASLVGASKPMGRKIFVGRIPIEATVEEVRGYFCKFGLLLDVYLPKDKEKTTHRGFGFVTFADESSVDQVVARTHEIRGQMLAIDQAAPMGEAPSAGSFFNTNSATASAGTGGPGPIRGGSLTASSNAGFGTLSATGGYDYSNPWGLYSSLPASSSKMEPRYRPY